MIDQRQKSSRGAGERCFPSDECFIAGFIVCLGVAGKPEQSRGREARAASASGWAAMSEVSVMPVQKVKRKKGQIIKRKDGEQTLARVFVQR